MKRIAEKDLRINCREFERQASWESLGFLLSETTIGNFASHSLCGWAADNTLVHGQSTDVLRTQHGRSAERARTFCGHSTDVLWTEHGRSVDRARTFRRQSTDVARTEHRRFAARARMFRGQSTDILWLAAQQFIKMHNRVTRHLSNLFKLLVMCTV